MLPMRRGLCGSNLCEQRMRQLALTADHITCPSPEGSESDGVFDKISSVGGGGVFAGSSSIFESLASFSAFSMYMSGVKSPYTVHRKGKMEGHPSRCTNEPAKHTGYVGPCHLNMLCHCLPPTAHMPHQQRLFKDNGFIVFGMKRLEKAVGRM